MDGVDQLWHDLTHKYNRWTLAAIVVVGAAFRLYHLDTFAIWRDEAQTVFLARHSFPGGILAALTYADVSPPLYYFLLHFWDQVIGSDWGLRFLSVAFGLVTIPLLYWVGRMMFDADVAVLAALVGALSPHHIVVSRTVRMYTLLPLISLVAIHFTLRFVTAHSTVRQSHGWLRDADWWGVVLSFLAALYTHNVGAFLVLCANLFFVWEFIWLKETRELLWPWIVAQICVALLYAPWVSTLLQQLRSQGAVMGPWLPHQSRLGNILRLFNELTGLAWPGEKPWLWLVVCALGVFGIRLRPRLVALYWRFHPSLDLVLLCFVGPIVLAAIATPRSIGMIPSYVTLVAFPGMCYLVARGVNAVRPRALSLLLLAALITIWIRTASVTYIRRTSNLREIASYVSAQIARDDIIVIAPDYLASSFNYYYDGPQEQIAFPSRFGRVEDITWVGWEERWKNAAESIEPTVRYLASQLQEGARLWLLAPLGGYPDDPYFSQIRVLKERLDQVYGPPQSVGSFPPAVEYAELYVYR